MQIDSASIVLRPRGHWEAMDMGFLFARRYFVTLWLLWCATALPVFLIINLCLINHPEFVTLVFWWLKPLFEALMVAWLGEALFNHPVSVSDQLKQIPQVIKQGVFSQLTWRRFSLSRSFNMPVAQLENNHGSELNNRLAILQTTQPHSGWLTILLLHIESAFSFAIPALLILLIPGEVEVDYETIFLSGSEQYLWLENCLHFLTTSLIAPFYVSAGFLLYINARTILEAWDIEIAFRQMANQKSSATQTTRAMCLALIVSLTGLCFIPTEATAISRNDANQAITTILEHDEFGKQEVVTSWEPILEDSNNQPESDWSWLNNLEWLGLAFKLIALIAIVALVIWLISKLSEHFDLGVFQIKPDKRRKTTTLPEFLTIDDKHHTLPENPVDSARLYCNHGRYREAVSLLFRVSLIEFIKHHQIQIPTSATERECLQIITRQSNPGLCEYFSTLMNTWEALAWAKQSPSKITILALCDDWPVHFRDLNNGL